MSPTPESSLYIHGQWCAGAATLINRNPSNLDDIIGHYAQADAAQAAQAVDAALAAQPGWAQTPLAKMTRPYATTQDNSMNKTGSICISCNQVERTSRSCPGSLRTKS